MSENVQNEVYNSLSQIETILKIAVLEDLTKEDIANVIWLTESLVRACKELIVPIS
jgi:hypothetical protein